MRFNGEWRKLQDKIEVVRVSCSARSISPYLSALLIAGEDHRFEYHFGVDPIALCRAIWRSVFCQRREGGSTIAMQLVRVLSGRYEKTISRKILEIYLAVKLTGFVPKNEIPALYLSVAYFGWKMNGLAQACERLKLDVRLISLQDAAGIIARLKYPEPKCSSSSGSQKIKIRSAYLLRRHEELPRVRVPISPQLSEGNGEV